MTTPESSPEVVPPVVPTSDFQTTRDMADQLTQPALTFDPATLRKGIVQSIETGTVTITLSGNSTLIPNVSYSYAYGPRVGDIVNIIQQGPNLLILDSIGNGATDWQTPTAASGSGWSLHNVKYRMYNDRGTLKIEWQGYADGSGSITNLLAALPADYRPSQVRRVPACRGLGNGQGEIVVQLYFNTDGTVNLAGSTNTWTSNATAPGTSNASSPGDTDNAGLAGATGATSPGDTDNAGLAGSTGSASPGDTNTAGLAGSTGSTDSGYSDFQSPGDTDTAGLAGSTGFTSPGNTDNDSPPTHNHSHTSTHNHGLSINHAHAHSNSHRHYTSSHSHSLSINHAHAHTTTHSHSLSINHAHAHTTTHTHSLSINHAHAHSGTHTHAHSATHTHTTTLTQPDWVSLDGVSYCK